MIRSKDEKSISKTSFLFIHSVLKYFDMATFELRNSLSDISTVVKSNINFSTTVKFGDKIYTFVLRTAD